MPPRKPAKTKEPTTIEEIQVALIKNLESEESALTNSRWERGILYTKARKLKASDKEFGAWCDQLPNVDEKSTISRMIQIVGLFSLGTYQDLGYSRAAIFCSNTLSKYPDLRDKLIADAIANNWTVKQCREGVNKALVPEPKQEDEPGAEDVITGLLETNKDQAVTISQQAAEIATLKENTSPFGDSESAHEQVSDVQRRQIGRLVRQLKARDDLLDLYVERFGRIPEHDTLLQNDVTSLQETPREAAEAAPEAPEQQAHAEVRVETGQAQEAEQAA